MWGCSSCRSPTQGGSREEIPQPLSSRPPVPIWASHWPNPTRRQKAGAPANVSSSVAQRAEMGVGGYREAIGGPGTPVPHGTLYTKAQNHTPAQSSRAQHPPTTSQLSWDSPVPISTGLVCPGGPDCKGEARVPSLPLTLPLVPRKGRGQRRASPPNVAKHSAAEPQSQAGLALHST